SYPVTQAVEPDRKRFLTLDIRIHNHPFWSCFVCHVRGSLIIEMRTLVRKHIKNILLFPRIVKIFELAFLWELVPLPSLAPRIVFRLTITEVLSQILLRRSCQGSCPCLCGDYAARE